MKKVIPQELLSEFHDGLCRLDSECNWCPRLPNTLPACMIFRSLLGHDFWGLVALSALGPSVCAPYRLSLA